jgi:hypothetical protein
MHQLLKKQKRTLFSFMSEATAELTGRDEGRTGLADDSLVDVAGEEIPAVPPAGTTRELINHRNLIATQSR